jgi:hypothetical protein
LGVDARIDENRWGWSGQLPAASQARISTITATARVWQCWWLFRLGRSLRSLIDANSNVKDKVQ